MSLQPEVLTFQVNTSGTTTTVSTAFQYKAVILVSHCKTALSETASGVFSIGFTDATNDASAASGGDDAVATSNVGKFWDTTRAANLLASGTPTVLTGGQLTSVAFNATPNMVLTWNATPAAATYITSIGFGGADITNTFVGNATLNTTISTQSITDVGFKPDFVFFLSGRTTVAGGAATWYHDIGCAVRDSADDGALAEWALTTHVVDAAATSAAVNGMSKLSATKCLMSQTSTNGDEYLASLSAAGAFTASGFDLNITDAPASAYGFAYLCIKGGRWACGTQAKPSTATTQTVTSTSFAPNVLAYLLSSPTALDTYTSDAVITFGGATSTSARGYAGVYHNDAINTVAKSAASATAISHEMNATANADFTSFNSNGWTITWDNTGTAFQSAWFAAGDAAGSAAEFIASVSGSATASAYLGTVQLFSGVSTNSSRMIMSLAGQIIMDGTADGTAAATAALTTSITAAAAVTGTATTAGALTTSILVVGNAQGEAVAVGELTIATQLDAEIDAFATATADLTTSITMVSAVSGTAAAEGILSVATSVDGSAMGTATATASLFLEIQLASGVSGTAIVTGDLFTSIPLEGSGSGTATVTGSLVLTSLFVSAITGTATATAALTTPLGSGSPGPGSKGRGVGHLGKLDKLERL